MAPTLTKVGIASSNATPSVAKKGDAATLTFTASESLQNLPEVTIAGQTANVTAHHWAFKHIQEALVGHAHETVPGHGK